MEGWRDSVATLAGVACWQPQTAYAGLQKSLQQEWDFVQSVTLDIGMSFQAVEDSLWDIFLPSLFQGDTSQIPGRAITSLPVKQSRTSLPEPPRTARENWTASCVVTGHLVAALYGTDEFRSGNHALLMGEEREEIRHQYAEEAETSLG